MDRTGKILGKATDARAWLPDSRRVIAVHAGETHQLGRIRQTAWPRPRREDDESRRQPDRVIQSISW